jgi:glycosyltransferase involved in cell wall biosynthesis
MITASWNVKNEEIFLGYSIMSVKDIADEFIVVDHGSVDRTLKVIKKCEKLLGKTIQVLHVSPDQPEPVTKNLKLNSAKPGNWVLWLDADEIFPYKEAIKIPAAIEEAEKQNKIGIYLFMVEFVNNFYTTCRKLLIPEIGAGGQGHRPRIFKNIGLVRVDGNWRKSKVYIGNKIHQEAQDRMLRTKILIYHYDRLKTNKEERYEKIIKHVQMITGMSHEACKRTVDNPKKHYYNIARNLDGAYKFIGIQPEVFKEYNFYNLSKVVRRCQK